jgi:ribosomal peptide maturation radical SAM protein 1
VLLKQQIESGIETGQGSLKRLALVSAPWPFFDRPSVQMGALKAFLNQRNPDIRVDTHHVYLKIAAVAGYEVYRIMSKLTWMAECPYGALLYPNHKDSITRYWNRKARKDPVLASLDFEKFCLRIEEASLSIIDEEPWDQYSLIGISISLVQLTSSLFFIREIKRRAPKVPIVVGGSACAGALGESLVQVIPQIDYVIRGEGELPLLQLIEEISASHDQSEFVYIPGLIYEDHLQKENECQQVPNMDDFPIPDYSDYFRDLESLGPRHSFLPRLPMEISRGCWWNKKKDSIGTGGCVFCNLNLQWSGYRHKSRERTVLEIDTLVKRHQLLSISFVDNLLPVKELEELFYDIQALGKDLRLFCELRAKTSRCVLEAMGGAGMHTIQVGVEALSTSLLKKLNKGITAMDNFEIMKNCESPCLPDLFGNLILDFPKSDSRDVAETLHNLSFAFPFRPLKGIPLWLGYGSPLWQDPGPFGIRPKGNHPNYRAIFPSEEFEKLRFMIQGYHGGVRHQRRMWEPVRKKLKEWRDFYYSIHEKPGFMPVLSYDDGKDFLIIHERRLHDDDMTHRLRGASRSIYLFCETQRCLAEIVGQFSRFGEDKILAFLRMMVDKRLMFIERDKYLSLAVSLG